jgi:two-component system response regulator VicR
MKKILIIENDTIIINILSFLLKKEGYEVHIAMDGNEGLDKISTVEPHLIITDVMLP